MPQHHAVGINLQSVILNQKIKGIVIWKKIKSKSNIEEPDTCKEKERSKELQNLI